jgi:urease accessory protein
MTLTDQALLRLCQLTDSAFPIGAFAHSFGLESYVARGLVHSAMGLEEFISNTLLHALAPSDGVACVAVYRAEDGWEEVVRELAQRLTAMKTVREFRQASRALGIRLLRMATQILALPRAARYLAAIEAKTLDGHLSLAYGAVCRDLEWPLPPALAAWFRQSCAALVSVGARLIPLGQTEGQALLARLGTPVLEAVELALGRDADDLASFAPGQELAGMIHRDVLTTRLYIS